MINPGPISFFLQLCNKYIRANGGRGLHDCVLEWSHSSQKNAGFHLDEKVLPDDRPKVIITPVLAFSFSTRSDYISDIFKIQA